MVANHLSLFGQHKSKLAAGQLKQALRMSLPVNIRWTNCYQWQMNLKITWCFYWYFVSYDSDLGFPWPCTSFIPDNLPNAGLFVGSDTKIILSNLKRVRSSPFARVSLSVFNLVNTDPSVKLQKSTQPSSISKFQQFLNKKKTRKVSETKDSAGD